MNRLGEVRFALMKGRRQREPSSQKSDQKATFGRGRFRSVPPNPTDIGRLPQYVRKGPRAALRFHDLQ